MKKNISSLILVVFLMSFIVACADASKNFTHLGITLQDQSQKIPTNFNFYILFLSPSHAYVEKNSEDKINNLGKEFDNFKKDIGDKNLALWCGTIDKDKYKYKFNVALSKYYADRYGLDYNEGPFLLITNINPHQEDRRGEDFYEISFSGIDPERIIVILNDVERQLRTQQNINNRQLATTASKQFIYSNYDSVKKFVSDIAHIIGELNIKF